MNVKVEKIVIEVDPNNGRIKHDSNGKPKIKGRDAQGNEIDCVIEDPAHFHELFLNGKLEYVGIIYHSQNSPWCKYYLIGNSLVKVCV